jgi:hypothetical protein
MPTTPYYAQGAELEKEGERDACTEIAAAYPQFQRCCYKFKEGARRMHAPSLELREKRRGAARARPRHTSSVSIADPASVIEAVGSPSIQSEEESLLVRPREQSCCETLANGRSSSTRLMLSWLASVPIGLNVGVQRLGRGRERVLTLTLALEGKSSVGFQANH